MPKREATTEEVPIPVGKAARTAVAGVTAATIGVKKLGLLSKRPFLSSEAFRREQAANDDEVAEVLFRGLSTLRGTALKVAQMMSLEIGMLPERYRRELAKSHHEVPPLNRAVIRQIFLTELGRPPEDVFASFDTTAFAAASLGQVHHARAHTGERLAVKVQYPGIGGAMANDLQIAKQFMLPFVRTEYIAAAVEELSRSLAEETDYELERRHTEWFYERGRMPGVIIPRTYPEFSSSRVLTTELVEGMHLARWLETKPSQECRDAVAQRLYDFFTRSFVELSRMHGDPNPGNYLFRDDGTIAVIDFGSVKVFAPELCRQVVGLWRAQIHGDFEQVITHYCSLGIARGDRKAATEIYEQALAPLDAWSMMPYRQEVFDFGEDPDYCTRGAALFREALRFKEMNGFTPETVLFDRNVYGLYLLFTELKARVRMKNQWIF